MKTRHVFLSLGLGLFAAAAFSQDLTLQELSRRPELLPAQVTLTKPVKLQNRPALPAGQKLTLVSVRGTQVEVETPDGRSVFSTAADDTDLLAAAQDAVKSLTPEQRALTYGGILQRKELWPYRVKLTSPQLLSGGELKVGEAVILVGTEGDQLLLAHEKGNFLFNAQPRHTDLLDAARQRLANPAAFSSRVYEDMSGKLVNPQTGAATAFDAKSEPKYYLFYRGAGWCGPCHQFSPGFIKYYKEAKVKYPKNFEVFFISGDRTPKDMQAYARQLGFSWNTVPQNRQPQMQVVNRLFSNFIPQLVVTDPAGNVVIDSAKVGGPQNALKQFDALLKKG